MALIHFLIVYDLAERRIVQNEEFENATRATKAYQELEERYGFDARYEIVLLGADSIETLKVTHGHYFPETHADRSAEDLVGTRAF